MEQYEKIKWSEKFACFMEEYETVFRIIIFSLVLLIIGGFTIYISVNTSKEIKEISLEEEELLEEAIHSETAFFVEDSHRIAWEKVDNYIDGHDYIIFANLNESITSVIHSPECSLCKSCKKEN